MTKIDIDALSLQLQRLRDSGEQVSTETFTSLPDVAEALATQEKLTFSSPVSDAWKVARSPDGIGVSARLHPLVEQTVGGTLPWHAGTQLEIEIAVRLGKDLPPAADRPYQRSDLLEAIETVYLGAELVRSVLTEGSKVSYPLFLADRLGNDGYVLGPELSPQFLDPSSTPALSITAADTVIFDATGKHPAGDTLSWLLDFANQPDRPASSLKAGALLTTGSLSGIIMLTKPGTVTADLAGAPEFSFSLV